MQSPARVRQIARDALGLLLRPAQEEAVAALASGRDCLAVLPSGAGKPAIYQVAAIALGGPATTSGPTTCALARSSTRSASGPRWPR